MSSSGDSSGSATGKVDVRFSESASKYRLKFYSVAPDQKEIIILALEKARAELGTRFDSVALEAICMNYLSGGNVTQK
jgi:hypothetical protein